MAGWQTIDDPARWDDWAAAQSSSNFQLAWDWGSWPASLGRTVWRRAFISRGKIRAGYIAVVIDSRRGRSVEIDGGLSLDRPADSRRWQAISDDLRTQARQAGAGFVRLRPSLADDPAVRTALAGCGWRLAPMPLGVEQAGLIDLAQTETEVLANCRQGLRRKLRRSLGWADVSLTTTTEPAAVEEFIRLHRLHAARLDYVPFPPARLRAQFEAFAAAGRAAIYWSQKAGQTLAMNMIFFFGRQACYHYGVSSDLGRQFPTAPRLHLQAMADARRRGLADYNFWGVVPPEQTGHRFWGVSQFKRSFGVVDFHYLPAHDLVLAPARYQLVRAVERWRRWRRRV